MIFPKIQKDTNLFLKDIHFIKSVYKGSTEEVIIVGIDGFDVGWAKEFQENDGTFLLFLERLDKAAFLTPVGGPNGMIQVVDDQVVPKEPFFDAILQRDAKDHEQGYDHFTPWQDYLWLLFIIGMFIILLSFLFISCTSYILFYWSTY